MGVLAYNFFCFRNSFISYLNKTKTYHSFFFLRHTNSHTQEAKIPVANLQCGNLEIIFPSRKYFLAVKENSKRQKQRQ